MSELIEVHTNPRNQGITAADTRILKALEGLKPQRRKRSKKKAETKKKKKKSRRRYKIYYQELAMGALGGAAAEMLIVRNPDTKDRIPAQVRRYSGALMAVAGYMGTMQKKAKPKMKSMAAGLMCAGLVIAFQDETTRMRADKVQSAMDKLEETMKEAFNIEGLGSAYPKAPYMSEQQAAAALGLQPRMPYQPHGELGDLVYVEGMGEIVMGQEPYDGSNNPHLSGLGEMVTSDPDGWLDGQFADAGQDWRSDGWG